MIERPPFRPAIDKIIIQNKTAVLTDKLRTFIIMNELLAPALRTNGRGRIVSALLLLLLCYKRRLLTLFHFFSIRSQLFQFFNFSFHDYKVLFDLRINACLHAYRGYICEMNFFWVFPVWFRG